MSVGDKAKKAGMGVLTATNYLLIGVHNAPRQQRIDEIDEEIRMLQEERARLEEQMFHGTDS